MSTLIPDSVDQQISSVPRRSVWRQLLRDPQAIMTGVIIVVLSLFGLLSPLISP